MNTSHPSIQVIRHEGVRLIGLSIRTDLKHRSDCPKLWNENFALRIPEIRKCEKGDAYGVSWVLDPVAGIFDYWATLCADDNAPIPSGMSETKIPAGLYAQCPIQTVKEIADTYEYIYTQWLPKNTQYTVNKDAPCFEYYAADHLETGRALVGFPIREK